MSNAYERVADAIREDLLRHKLAKGERLPDEMTLAQRYGVGRSTIRESLRVLGGRGWLRTVRGGNGGVFVTDPDPIWVGYALGDDLALLLSVDAITFSELAEARHIHEESAARLAARRAGPAEVHRLRTLADAGQDLIDQPVKFTEINLAFHVALTEAAHNRLLLVWTGALHNVLEDVMTRATVAEEARGLVVRQHQAIADAVASGDSAVAMAATRAHLNDFETSYHTG